MKPRYSPHFNFIIIISSRLSFHRPRMRAPKNEISRFLSFVVLWGRSLVLFSLFMFSVCRLFVVATFPGVSLNVKQIFLSLAPYWRMTKRQIHIFKKPFRCYLSFYIQFSHLCYYNDKFEHLVAHHLLYTDDTQWTTMVYSSRQLEKTK
jgi:hypothetical protein